MAKVPFSKLKAEKNQEIKTVVINDQTIEVKQYLPSNDKLGLISNVINMAANVQEGMNFANPVLIEICGTLEIIYAYTNISFTEKQKEDPTKLYDLLDNSGIIDAVMNLIPEAEYNFIIDGIDQSVESIYQYHNSFLGILETLKTDYSNLDLDAQKIQKMLNSNPEELGFLKEVLTKLG